MFGRKYQEPAYNPLAEAQIVTEQALSAFLSAGDDLDYAASLHEEHERSMREKHSTYTTLAADAHQSAERAVKEADRLRTAAERFRSLGTL